MAYFPHIHEALVSNPNILTLVQNEYIEYQSMIKDKIPKRICQEATLEKKRYRMNVVLEHLKD